MCLLLDTNIWRKWNIERMRDCVLIFLNRDWRFSKIKSLSIFVFFCRNIKSSIYYHWELLFLKYITSVFIFLSWTTRTRCSQCLRLYQKLNLKSNHRTFVSIELTCINAFLDFFLSTRKLIVFERLIISSDNNHFTIIIFEFFDFRRVFSRWLIFWIL